MNNQSILGTNQSFRVYIEDEHIFILKTPSLYRPYELCLTSFDGTVQWYRQFLWNSTKRYRNRLELVKMRQTAMFRPVLVSFC